MIGIIGGTGFYTPGLLEQEKEMPVKTPYGEASLTQGAFHGHQLAFLARHGVCHTVPPHLVNYRANIWALRSIGVTRMIATAAVGSLKKDWGAGSLLLLDQFIDFTKSRPSTFFEGGEEGVLHTDLTNPYCPDLNRSLAGIAGKLGIKVHLGATYVCTEGPRYETPAEIKMYRLLGGEVVGMTSVPEVVLAREAGLCYATLALVTNYAAGISDHPLSHLEVVAEMERTQQILRKLIFSAVEQLPLRGACTCSRGPAEAGSMGQPERRS